MWAEGRMCAILEVHFSCRQPPSQTQTAPFNTGRDSVFLQVGWIPVVLRHFSLIQFKSYQFTGLCWIVLVVNLTPALREPQLETSLHWTGLWSHPWDISLLVE